MIMPWFVEEEPKEPEEPGQKPEKLSIPGAIFITLVLAGLAVLFLFHGYPPE